MNRRRALWVLGALSLLLGGVLLAIDSRLFDEGGPGIIGFEFAGTEERAGEILDEWGEEGRDAARLSLWLDFAYLAAYGAFWTLAVAAIRDGARRRSWSRFTSIGSVAVVLPAIAAVLDALEDVNLLLVVAENGGDTAPRVAAICAAGKFLAIAAAVLYVLVGLVRLAFRRYGRRARLVAIGLIALLALLLAANTWALERQTRDAKADGGRVLSLPQGDVHVREDGDRADPPLVLLHGFAVSMRWWDTVVPALARDHRVIRIDLLGHGGSEKPRDGYSMEEQADQVAAALDRLGVRRTAVVGHSLGGIVATALVERHRALVSRLFTIGTAPDLEHLLRSLSDRLSFLPVVGHASWRLVSESYVRSQVEEAFIPEVDARDRLVADAHERITYRALRESVIAVRDFWDEQHIDDRLADEKLPLTVVYGTRDRIVDWEASKLFRDVPDAKIVILRGLGHTPQIERPALVARLIRDFAR